MNQEDKKKLMKCIVFTLLLSPPYTLSLLLAVCSRNPDPGPNIRSRLGFPPPSPLRFVPSSTSRKTSALFALVDSSRISKGRYDRRTFFSKNFPNKFGIFGNCIRIRRRRSVTIRGIKQRENIKKNWILLIILFAKQNRENLEDEKIARTKKLGNSGNSGGGNSRKIYLVRRSNRHKKSSGKLFSFNPRVVVRKKETVGELLFLIFQHRKKKSPPKQTGQSQVNTPACG